MPTDQQIIKFAILFNDGELEADKLSDMVAMCQMIIDRLYENGDVLIPSSKENYKNFVVQCKVCGQQYENWTGSTPCCGSVAYIVEDGKVTDKLSLFASINGSPIKPTEIHSGSKPHLVKLSIWKILSNSTPRSKLMK